MKKHFKIGESLLYVTLDVYCNEQSDVIDNLYCSTLNDNIFDVFEISSHDFKDKNTKK